MTKRKNRLFMTEKKKYPMGVAIADYNNKGTAEKLRVFAQDFEEDEIPVETLFRDYDSMPLLEQKALEMAEGRILDVGAGAGCHSLALQKMGKEVTAIDISPESVATMVCRGVRDAREKDFWLVDERFDTILMLMNGIGIIGTLSELPRFFRHLDNILSDNGEVILDSTDICYIFEEEDGIIVLPQDGYYGEMEFQMQYKDIIGEKFPWLYIDFDTLSEKAEENGFLTELIAEGEHYDFLARIRRK